jgi:hypothetical protein
MSFVIYGREKGDAVYKIAAKEKGAMVSATCWQMFFHLRGLI